MTSQPFARHSPGLASWIRAEPALALLCVVVLAIPLEATRRYLPFGLLDAARIGMIVGVALAVWLVATRRSSLVAPRTLALPVLAIVAVEAISLVSTGWPSAPKSFLATASYAAFAAFVAQAARTRSALTALSVAFVVSGALQAGITIAQSAFEFHLFPDYPAAWIERRSGTFWDPNLLARMLVLTQTAGLGLLVGGWGSRRVRWALLGAMALMAFGLVLTGSRTGWLLFALVLVLWVPFTLRRAAGRSGLVVVAAAFALGFVLNPLAAERAGDIPQPGPPGVAAPGLPSERTTTALDPLLDDLPIDGTRRYLARAAVAMFEDHPLSGVGLGGFQPMILGPYRAFGPGDGTGPFISLAHTDVLRVAAEEGLVGLLALGSLFAGVVVTARRALRDAGDRVRMALVVSTLGIGIVALASQTEGRFYSDPYLWLFVGVLAALTVRGDAEGRIDTADAATARD